MNADEHGYKHVELTGRIIGVFYEVYSELGFGFLESVYREAMLIALRSKGLSVEKDFKLKARFRGHVIGEFKADLLVGGSVITELKAARSLEAAHQAQTLNYLRAGVLEVGLLLNFGPKPQVRRLVFGNFRKPHGRLPERVSVQGRLVADEGIRVHPRSSAAPWAGGVPPHDAICGGECAHGFI